MRSCQIPKSVICMTKVVNKPSRREAWQEENLPWTFSTCSLVVEAECREKGEVRHIFIAPAVSNCEMFHHGKSKHNVWGGVLNIVYELQSLSVVFHIHTVVNFYGNILSYSGKNVVHQLGVTLEELYNGSTRKLGLQKNVICEKCEGKNGY